MEHRSSYLRRRNERYTLIAGGTIFLSTLIAGVFIYWRFGYYVVKILVEAGADVNVADHIKMTPLMHAVMGCDEERIVYLVEHGADVTARNSIGSTAFHFAASVSSVSPWLVFLRNY